MPSRVYVQEIGAKTLDHDKITVLEACAKRKQSRFLARPTVLLMRKLPPLLQLVERRPKQ
jgi:hypothetical protein